MSKGGGLPISVTSEVPAPHVLQEEEDTPHCQLDSAAPGVSRSLCLILNTWYVLCMLLLQGGIGYYCNTTHYYCNTTQYYCNTTQYYCNTTQYYCNTTQYYCNTTQYYSNTTPYVPPQYRSMPLQYS